MSGTSGETQSLFQAARGSQRQKKGNGLKICNAQKIIFRKRNSPGNKANLGVNHYNSKITKLKNLHGANT